MKKLTNIPTLADILEVHREEIFSNLNCHAVGKIEQFNHLEQTAIVSIDYQRRVENIEATYERSDYKNLIDIPVIVVGGGNGSLRFPIKAGDNCLVFFNDRDIDNWFTSGSKSPLASDRKHSFSDGVALVGLRSMADNLDDYDPDRTELVHDKTVISLEDKIRIKNLTSNMFDVIDGLFAQLDFLVPTTGIPAANKAAIAALRLQFQQLMEH